MSEVDSAVPGDDAAPPSSDPVTDAMGDAPAAGVAAPGEGEIVGDAQPEVTPTQGAEAMSEEAIVALIAERDEYLDALQRMKADFANARRRSDEQAATQRQHAAADLVSRLLPVLDSAEAALSQGVEEVRPLSDALFDALASQGLARLDPVGEAFDPEQHEAVMFESGEGEQVVVETMRLGYLWNDRVLRAAMVKVRG